MWHVARIAQHPYFYELNAIAAHGTQPACGGVMSSRRHAFFAFTSLSLVSFAVACGGAIDSPRSETVDPATPAASGSAKSGGVKGSNGECTAAPACDPGDTKVANESACAQDDATCYSRSTCGAKIRCSGGTTCAAVPSCPPDYIEAPNGCTNQDCIKSTVCGKTITCQRDLSQCDGYPVCNPGDTQVASSSQCLQDDATCYQRWACGSSIWCTGPLPQDAGLPPPPLPPMNP
jgi:hypothetical protein